MRKLYIAAAVAMLTTNLSAIESKDVSVSGHFLGLYNYINQDAINRVQFDYAANLDFEFEISDKVSGIVQLQGGTGDGSMGFVGPEPAVTDINLVYQRSESLEFTFGSFDTPFGNEVSYLTNNADSSNNNFLSNSLMYSALAGPAGTLNTLGVKGIKNTSYGDWTLSLTNGTGENSVNHDNTFEYLIGYGTDKLLPGLKTSASYLVSKDSADSTDETSTSFGADISGWILDANYTFNTHWNVKGYVGALEYDDKDSSTDDGVQFAMIEAAYKPGKWFAATRVSTWTPEDDNGDNSGISSAITNPGFATTAGSFTEVNDANIIRYQIGGGYELEPNMWLKGELLSDQYNHGQNVNGLFVYINTAF